MTTPKTAPPSTAVATKGAAADALQDKLLEKAQTFEDRQLAFRMADEVRRASMIRQAALALAEQSWGKGINPVARAAVARYCFEIGADPMRHVFVLGGTIYINAECYRELVAADPEFDHDEWEFIHADARRSAEDQDRCRSLRLKFGCPEETTGACIVRLYFKNRGEPIIGCNWVKVGKHPNGKDRDPVGLEHPTQTAHSRAYRKAAMKAIPTWFKKHPRFAAAEEVLTKGRELESLPPPQPEPANAGDPPASDAPPAEPTAPKTEAGPGLEQSDLALDRELAQDER